MFKKLFNSLMGNDEEKKPQTTENNFQDKPVVNQQEEEDDDDEYEDNEPVTWSNGFATHDTNQYDPETHHGMHYTKEQFDAEVEREVNEWMEDKDSPLESDIINVRINTAKDLYREWNPGVTESQYMRFSMSYESAARGRAVFGSTKHDDSNPLLQPIHGVSLQDYGAGSSKMISGVSAADICKALGIEQPVWEEACSLWVSRMQQDNSSTVSNLLGTYFAEAGNHPKLGNLAAVQSEAGKANLEKLGTDRYFYEELCGARQAAYEYGLDGAQWILDNYGIALGDFQSVAVKYMAERNNNFNANEVMHYHNYQMQKQKEYAAKFAAEQGGNVADDVEF